VFLIHVSGWTVVQPKWCWLQCVPDYIRPSPQVHSTVSALMFNRAIFYSNMLYQSFSVLCCLLEPAKFFFLLNSWLVLLVSRPFCGSYILTSLERIYVVRKFEEALWIACIASWCLLALPLPGFHTTHYLPTGIPAMEQENPAMEPAALVLFMCCRSGPKQIIFYLRRVLSLICLKPLDTAVAEWNLHPFFSFLEPCGEVIQSSAASWSWPTTAAPQIN